ncbi:5-formyltetrahydrofolate cyclo-ligase [Limnovirga soli]|jgi:5-formyltetrahydrofolate cyclo-ligase|uniref:5-formyltetrahydrofolate cyclo-ligase n=1 Tax=Limnovirga soli TaxID=2656915 RepID=A0A8J8FD22_9BACT|nr:5-formyltetrahydrofolate cyclo-ligase [Limnovirga soli]NNV54442.1 5-formyltetrahydrofolate cyclo-ligase [Limnovirga soli]
MIKKDVRKLYKEKRNSLSDKEKLKLDDLLLIQFQQFYFDETRHLLTYWPMAHMQEPNTHLFSGYMRHMVPGLEICYPLTDFGRGTMEAIAVNEDTVYTTSSLHITEPKEGIPVAPYLIDVVFVPLLAVDIQGYRVGYGKGFYDKYLANCRSDIIKIGFSYFDPIEIIEDKDAFDVPLNYCVTPQQLYEF